jgi:hypothetical protein
MGADPRVGNPRSRILAKACGEMSRRAGAISDGIGFPYSYFRFRNSVFSVSLW